LVAAKKFQLSTLFKWLWQKNLAWSWQQRLGQDLARPNIRLGIETGGGRVEERGWGGRNFLSAGGGEQNNNIYILHTAVQSLA
jgi:hypothetical protein